MRVPQVPPGSGPDLPQIDTTYSIRLEAQPVVMGMHALGGEAVLKEGEINQWGRPGHYVDSNHAMPTVNYRPTWLGATPERILAKQRKKFNRAPEPRKAVRKRSSSLTSASGSSNDADTDPAQGSEAQGLITELGTRHKFLSDDK